MQLKMETFVPKALPLTTVVIMTRAPALDEHLGNLLALLANQGVHALAVPDPAAANQQLQRSEIGEVQCVMIDLMSHSEGDEPGHGIALSYIREMATDPDIAPILVARSPSPALILAGFRAGASDLIDLDREPDEHILATLQHTAVEHYRRVQRRKRVSNLRVVLEDMLETVIKSEQRAIDLEQLLAARDNDFIPNRNASVLVVDDDSDVVDTLVELLEHVGIDAHSCPTGEDAVAHVRQRISDGKAIDMVLVDQRMPGMSGLDTIRALRAMKPNLTAMLMTAYSDKKTAVGAADLGVVGYAIKPFDDTLELVTRVKNLAVKSMNDARGRHYLEQIKERHAKVLLRYRRLAADLEQLVV